MPSNSTRILVALAWAALPAASLRAQIVPPTYIELSRTTTVTAAGREVIAIRVRPPAPTVVSALPPSPSSAPAPTWSETQEEQRLAAKKQDTLTVFATVYSGYPVLTELRWSAAGREWLAYSNVNFEALTQLSSIETADTVYQWFPFVSDGDTENRPRPPGLVFSGPEAEYLVYASRAEWEAAPEAFAALDWLHVHYEENRARLDTTLALRRAEAARLAALPPPPSKPVIIRYHVPASPSTAPASSAQGGAQ